MRAEPTHSHSHQLSREKLRLGFYLTLLLLTVEIAGGLISHSLALLSDAGHMLTDAAALGLAWFAAVQASRPANERRTFGYHRVGILSALINGLTLVLIAGGISVEAYRRFGHPQKVAPGVMIAAALLAIGINLYIGRGLHAAGHGNLNARAAALHVFGDVGASVGVIVGAVAIALTGATWVDPLVSVLIAVLIAFGALRLILEAGNILMESAPRGVSVPDLVRDMLRVPGVHDVHDLHVWSIASGMLALSCHCVIDDLPPSDSAPTLDRITDMLRNDFGITHSTIQFESEAHTSHAGFCACPPDCADSLYCALQSTEDERHAHSH
jgi:cobalt-zinc-cadmium efflux system protein